MPLKVLYINNFSEGTGWSNAGINYILALDAVGVNVVPRRLRLTGGTGEVPKRVLELEQNSSSNPDVVIQHTLPHLMDYNGRIKRNVGLVATETDNFSYTMWPEFLRAMDDRWVINVDQMFAFESVGLPGVHIIPHACDVTKYQQEYEKINLPPETNDTFIFYFIGEFNKRKNLEALIKAFHIEFGPNEPVSLVIKTSIPGKSGEEAGKIVGHFCSNIKAGLKLYRDVNRYKPEIIVTQFLSEHDLMRLHKSCDCFVMPSYGEAWGIPLFDAMGVGNQTIATDYGGPADYLDGVGQLVPCKLEPCYEMTNTFEDLYTGREKWAKIDGCELMRAMRNAFNKSDEQKADIRERSINKAYEYSHSAIGKLVLEKLES